MMFLAMNVIEIFQTFQTQEQAIEYLETVRWRGRTLCPYCDSENVCRHASGDRAMQRWQCWACERSFSVTVGTIFHGTHVSLRNWFLLLELMLNAKKSASACQIARDLGMRRPTVWSMMHRVRMAIANDQAQADLLYGIVEADECYIGGRPRKGKYPVGLRPTSHGHRECPIRAFLSPEHSNVDGVPFLSSGKQYPRQMDSLFPSQAKTYCMEVVYGLFWATTYLTN